MLKMKLPQRKSKHKASDEEDDEEERAAAIGMCSRPCSLRECCPPGTGPAPLQREAVYEWFVRSLGPAQRLEFACGLLDLCNPLELRFLGSCLEDLARKDCHYLRDCETRANGLGGEPGLGLGDLSDRTARSKLVVYLALLSSENREVAGRLYRLLLLPAMATERLLGGWQDREQAASREELLLLYTMASLHPAFSFHQRVTLRERLEQLREAMCKKRRSEGNKQEHLPNHEKHAVDGSIGTYNGVLTTSHSLQQEAVHIENISFKHVQRRRADKNSEYTFQVTWSDNSKTSVTKSYRELVEFLLTLPKELSNEHIDKTIIDALHLGKRREEYQYSDLEPIVQQIFSSPSQALLQNQRVYRFFNTVKTESGHPGHLQGSLKCCKNSEDSSETSSQEEDGIHHPTGYKKSGKSLVTNYVAVKSTSSDGVHSSHLERNGTDWRKNDCIDPLHPSHYLNDGRQCTLEKRSSHVANRENTERSNQKVDGRSPCKANGVISSHNSRASLVNDLALEVGSGHETCGETSSESYSSPPSPRHNRRESFESEEEKDRDTDSNSEGSGKRVSGFPNFGAVNRSSAKLTDHLPSNEESSIDEPLNGRNFPTFSILPGLHCMMPTNVEKLDHSHPLPTEGKTLGMIVSPVPMPPVREVIHQNSLGVGVATVASAIGESEKCIDILTCPMSVPSTFLPRNCSPSSPALQMPIQRLKVPTQGSVEACTVNGSTQTNIGLGTASAGFISIHNHGGFAASPVTVSEPLSKPISQVASLNQVVPHLDGNVGIVSPATNVKLVLSGTNMTPAPSTVPYPLSGPSLPSGVLPTPNTNVLNAAASVAPQPANGGIGQVQSVVPLTVPTHSPGPAPSPSPALTHSTAQSDSTSFISAAVGNTSTNGTLLPPQQMGPGACGSCGRRCSCGVPMGSYYYPNPIPGQMFTRVPFPFPIPSICNSTYLNQAHQSNGTHYPVFLPQPPYTNGLMHDPVLGSQANYGMQQMAGFARLYPIYPTTNVVGNANGSVTKKNGNISCFNCGVAGHYAQDCKQPPMEANQQGTFRLRYAPLPNTPDSLDSAD